MAPPTSISEASAAPENSEESIASERMYAWKVADSLVASFRYAGQGISYGFRTQRNFRIHSLVAVIVVSTGMILRLPNVQIAVLCVTCGIVMTLELVNTALEAVVDLTVKQTYHELAKVAKDCAAGAVLIAALMAVFVGGCLLVPPFVAALSL